MRPRPSHTFPYFEIDHKIFSRMRGRFDRTSGTLSIDLKERRGAVDIVIDTASISTGEPAIDKHLRTADFFDVAKFPTMRFKSDKLVFDGDKLVRADGELTMLGVTQPVTLSFNKFTCGDDPLYKKYYCGGDASTTIKRSEYGLNAYLNGGLGNEVKVMIQVEAARGPKAGL